MYGEEGDEDKYGIDQELWSKYHFYLQLIRIPYKNNLNLLRLLQVAYSLGQLSVVITEKNIFKQKVIEYYNINQLDDINSYAPILDTTELIEYINNYVNQLIK